MTKVDERKAFFVRSGAVLASIKIESTGPFKGSLEDVLE